MRDVRSIQSDKKNVSFGRNGENGGMKRYFAQLVSHLIDQSGLTQMEVARRIWGDAGNRSRISEWANPSLDYVKPPEPAILKKFAGVTCKTEEDRALLYYVAFRERHADWVGLFDEIGGFEALAEYDIDQDLLKMLRASEKRGSRKRSSA